MQAQTRITYNLNSAMFTPSRLKLARQRLGWTLKRLSEESGVSLRTLTTYEKAPKHEPTAEIIERLAKALGVQKEFFFKDIVDPVVYQAVSFRKLSKTSALMRDAALASANLGIEFFEVLEKHFALPSPDIPNLGKHSPEMAADLIRNLWKLGDKPIPNLFRLLESKGIRILSLSHKFDDIDAFCFARDRNFYIFLNTSKTGERQRFDLAHELGHLVLHRDIEMVSADSKDREAQAHRFASALLMPQTGVLAQSMNKASIDRILAAKKYWKTSAMAMTYRLKELNLLSDWQYRSTCIELAEQGYRRSEPDGMIPETSLLLRKVLFGENKIGLRTVGAELDLSDRQEVSEFVKGLVPVAA